MGEGGPGGLPNIQNEEEEKEMEWKRKDDEEVMIVNVQEAATIKILESIFCLSQNFRTRKMRVFSSYEQKSALVRICFIFKLKAVPLYNCTRNQGLTIIIA